MSSFTKKIRTALVGSAVAVGSLGVAAAIDAAPAAAATSVTFCFSYQNPPTFSAYANKPVYLYEQLPHGTYTLRRSGSTGANGCATFYNTNPTVNIGVKAFTSTQYMTWESALYTTAAGPRAANLGTLPVFRTR